MVAYGISERKSQLDSQLVSAGEAADKFPHVGIGSYRSLISRPFIPLSGAVSFVSKGGACPTGVKGQGGLCTSASILPKATILD